MKYQQKLPIVEAHQITAVSGPDTMGNLILELVDANPVTFYQPIPDPQAVVQGDYYVIDENSHVSVASQADFESKFTPYDA